MFRKDPALKSGAIRGNRYRFRITSDGFMLLIVMVLVGFAAWHSGTNLLYLIFAILMALYVLHGSLLWVNLKKISVSAEAPDTVIMDQSFDVAVKVINQKHWFSSYALRVTHHSPGKSRTDNSLFFGSIRKKESSSAYYSTTFHRRGIQKLGDAVVATSYPFGFEERRIISPTRKNILCLPRTYNISGLESTITSQTGDQETMIKGAGTDLYGLREYFPGEHARHIHWRTSARIQKLMVAEFARDEHRQIMLFLDNGVEPELHYRLAAAFENAITLTASLSRHFINLGFEVGLVTADKMISFGQSQAQLLIILKHLATLDLRSPHPFGSLPDKLLFIEYHSHGSSRVPKQAQRIDSRQWSPPAKVSAGNENL